jgi:preprotein translocase subunit SecE
MLLNAERFTGSFTDWNALMMAFIILSNEKRTCWPSRFVILNGTFSIILVPFLCLLYFLFVSLFAKEAATRLERPLCIDN